MLKFANKPTTNLILVISIELKPVKPQIHKSFAE